jgi:DNA/RNA-binding domain of Phe-tRNA-synthetase-like protein
LHGSVDPLVEAEFPGLTLTYEVVDVARRNSPREVKDSLDRLAPRINGATAVTLRTSPIVLAYRTFYRQIGLDPDLTPPPAEQAVLDRIYHGGFKPQHAILDAITLAAIETGVSVWALDLDQLGEPLPLHLGSDDEQELRINRTAPIAVTMVQPTTRRAVLYSLAVPGVSQLSIDEALWIATGAVRSGGSLPQEG